jgi:Fic family protein
MARAVSTYASNRIEGNPIPLTEVKKILKSRPDNIKSSEKEILNYNQALENLHQLHASDSLELSLNLILKIHKQVTLGLLPTYESGHFRQKPVVVNDPRSGKVVYLPPDFDQVEGLVKDLLGFVRENSQIINPLILAGIFHKQMVIIHPFMDGNGRTTRLATKVLLAKMGLNTFNLFSFENYYNQDVTQYFQMVGEFGDYCELADSIDFTAWLEYFTFGLIDELLRVQNLLPKIGPTPESRLENHHLLILETIKSEGFITDRAYAQLTDRAKATRTIDFKKLIDLGLIQRKGKGRATYYVLEE